jgi:signal transduction histidine kinase
VSDFISEAAIDSNNERHIEGLQAFPDAVRKMTEEANPEKLLRTICATAIDILNASTGSLLIWNPESDRLYFQVTGDDTSEQLEGKSMPSDAGLAGWAFTHREPLIAPDVRQDERFYSAIDESLGHQTSSLMAAPLMTQHQMLGVIEVLNKRSGESFDELDLDILVALAGQASIAIDNIRMHTKLKRQRQRLIAIEQEVHKKLARDLHDGPSQWLASISMNMEYIWRLMDTDPAQAKIELEIIRHRLNKVTEQIRNLMFELRPILLESHDLQTALKHYIDNLNQTNEMNISLSMGELRTKLSPRTERAIFDIIREAISNIKRHAYTSDAWVDFHTDNLDTLTITIRDNGLGFDPSDVRQDYSLRGSLGMLNMTERAELLNGKLTIDSVSHEGATITLTIPLQQQDKPQ